MVELTLNGEKTAMELDKGAAVSVIFSAAKAKLFPQLKPESTSVILATYTGEKISVLGLLQTLAKCPFLWHFLHSASRNLQAVASYVVYIATVIARFGHLAGGLALL